MGETHYFIWRFGVAPLFTCKGSQQIVNMRMTIVMSLTTLFLAFIDSKFCLDLPSGS